jgi:hypothetical protein
MSLMELAVDTLAAVEQVVDTLVADTLVAALAAVADRQSERSAAHPYIAALRISWPRDGPQHRLLHLLQLPSRVVFFFF